MTLSSSGITELTATYAAQVAADLDHNAKQQQRLNAEIESLQKQLAALQDDHALLQNMTTALQALTLPMSAEQGPERQQSGATARPSRTRTTGGTRPAAKKAAVRPTRRKDSTATTRPTLVELIRSYLTAQDEPRSAADVTDALTRAHSERSIKPKVVRVTIEGLVARGQVQRHKHNRSVTYTARSYAFPTGA